MACFSGETCGTTGVNGLAHLSVSFFILVASSESARTDKSASHLFDSPVLFDLKKIYNNKKNIEVYRMIYNLMWKIMYNK